MRWFAVQTVPVATLTNTAKPLYYPSGGALLIHRTADQQLGDWDERFFLYYEDVAYALAARRVKIPIQAISEPVVEHIGGLSSRTLGTPRLLYYHYRNSLLVQRRYGPWWVRLLLPWWSLALVARHTIQILTDYQHTEHHRAIIQGVLDNWIPRY